MTELKALIATEKESSNVDGFLSIVRKYTDIKELTPELIREFVEKVYVYKTERVDGFKIQRIRIVWNCIGEVVALALLFLFDFFLRRFFLCSLLFHKIEIVWLDSIV